MIQGKGLLTPLQQAFLALFAHLPDQDQFYLTGGTALAEYYLGHRLSFDLDLFTSQASLILPTSYLIEQQCAATGMRVSITRRFASYVAFFIEADSSTLRVDLALASPFRFEVPRPTVHGVLVNDYQDLIVDKLLAYYGRAEPRDAVDLYFILQQQNWQPLLELAEKKDPGFDRYWMAVALNRAEHLPDELERWPVQMLLPVEPSAIKAEFGRMAAELMDQLSTQ